MGTPHFLIQGSFGPLDLVVHDIIVIFTALVLFSFRAFTLPHECTTQSDRPCLGGVSNALGCVTCTILFDIVDIFGTWHYFVPAPNFVC